MAPVALALYGAAVVCLIGAASIFGSNGNAGWALFCVGMAIVFAALAVGLWWRERANLPQQFSNLLRAHHRRVKTDRRDRMAELRRQNPGVPDSILLRMGPTEDEPKPDEEK